MDDNHQPGIRWRRFLGALGRLCKGLLIMLLILELILVYGVGSLLGALGEANDAKGLVLLIGPLSVLVSLIAAWLFSEQKSTWLLAVVALFAPIWASVLFGPASEDNLWPFWAEALATLTLITWVLVVGLRVRNVTR